MAGRGWGRICGGLALGRLEVVRGWFWIRAPWDGLELDVGQGKPLATLAPRGLWEHTAATPARGGRREIRGCPGHGAKSRRHESVTPRLGYPRQPPASLSLSLGETSESL